ncbi:MAG TPA: alpha-hydroxy acid oxidase [Vicinamibacterales bacterium]|nr:alpha-hydroxy acid oxidase [Vicinamibacterales bacterium]
MGTIERRWQHAMSRRKALTGLAGMLAGSPLLHAQLDPRPYTSHRRAPGLNEMFTAFDFEPVMFANVSQSVYDYTAHGDGGEWNLRRNRQAFDWVDILPGKAIDPSTVDLSSELLGLKLKYPIMIAPTATQVALHPDGEAGMYRAAQLSSNTPMCLSTNSSQSFEQVAKGAQGGQLWWQFYPRQDMGASQEVLERVQGAGYAAIVITVDQQASFYERSQHDRNLGGRTGGAARGGRAGGAAPARQGAPPRANDPEALGTATIGRGAAVPGAAAQAAPAAAPRGAAAYRVGAGRLWYSWEYMDQVRKFIKTPIIIKGIVTAEDARICVERGFDGIVVSNHGGRSMDYGPSTLEVLPEIVAAVNGKIPVMIDSGFRRGSDVLKALALGADAVWLGRASRWALGAFGPPGVQRLLEEIIFKELVSAAAYAGKTTLASIDTSIVKQSWP